MAPRRKIDDDTWARMYADYLAWDPGEPGAPTIAEVIAPYGIAKQTFYNEMTRRGLSLKTVQVVGPSSGALEVMLEQLVAARARIKVLEEALRAHGIGTP